MVPPTSTSVGLDAVGGESPGLRLADARRRRTGRSSRVTGGCAADSPAISATVMVRLHRSNETLPWLALAPLARTVREGRLDFVRDLLLDVEFEAEKAARRDHDGGDQRRQEF